MRYIDSQAVILIDTSGNMFETICDINKLNHSNPFFYTERYLQNDYVKANDLAKHIHLFNHQISRLDYSFLGDLKGLIQKIESVEKEKIYDGAISSNLFEIKNTIYNFNKNLELYQILTNANGSQENLIFSDSLKKPQKLQVVKSFDNNPASQIETTYNDFLEYETIEEITFYNGKKSNWVKPNEGSTKYHFKENGQIHKIHIRNNKDEQSKTTVIYNSSFQILESKTFSQKNKSELLYEAIFNYEHNKLMKVIYIRHNPTKLQIANFIEELIFEYNKKGLLINFKDNFRTTSWAYDRNDNPVSVKEFDNSGICVSEMTTNYKYDKYNNWTYKEMKTVVNKVLKKEKQIARAIEYF